MGMLFSWWLKREFTAYKTVQSKRGKEKESDRSKICGCTADTPAQYEFRK